MRISIILAALVLLAPSSVYAQGFSQDAGSEEAGTKEAIRQERSPGVAKLATPNPKTGYTPPPLQLSDSQRAMLPPSVVAAADRQAAALQGATRYNVAPMELSASQQAMLEKTKPAGQQPAVQEPPAEQAAAEQTENEYCPGEGATVFDEKGIPHFEPPQYFPQGPAQRPVPISQINVPSPSFPAIPPAMGDKTGLVNDASRSSNIYDDCPELSWQDELQMINNWTKGKAWGFIIGKGGDSGQIDMWLDAMANSDFAFQYGFLAGLAAADCDPDFYAELYKKLLKKAQEAEQKPRKKSMDMFNVQPASGGGFGPGSSGGGPPC